MKKKKKNYFQLLKLEVCIGWVKWIDSLQFHFINTSWKAISMMRDSLVAGLWAKPLVGQAGD